MKVVERKPVPLYESICQECKSKIYYRKSEASISHIRCPVCGTSNWAESNIPIAWEYVAEPEIIRCCECGFWNRETLRHQFNDFRDWNEAECMKFEDRDGYHEIDWYTEADDFCSHAERKL